MSEEDLEAKRSKIGESSVAEVEHGEEDLEAKCPKISESGAASECRPEVTNTLTYYALLTLFTWLSREDLVSVQRVCHSWREAAHDQSLWKNFTLTLDKHYYYKDLKNINTMKAVRNINGNARNAFINVIINNIKDLKRLNCKFIPAMTSSQVDRLLEAFPELESISVSLTAVDIVQFMEKLKTSEYLKEICFYIYGYDKKWDSRINFPHSSKTEFQQNILKVFETFNDMDNFKALEGLHIEECLNEDIFHNQIYSDAVADFVCKRSHQLSSLSLQPTTEILTNINTCVKLKKLSLPIDQKCDIGVAIENMNELEVLKIDIREEDNFLFLTELQNSMMKNSWSHLVEIFLGLNFREEVQILKSVIQNAKLLKELCFYDDREVTGENQIAEIDTLLKLESLTLVGLKTLFEKSLSTISNCKKLKYLQLIACKSVCQNQHLYVANMVRGMEKLSYCELHTNAYTVDFSGRANIEKLLSDYPSDV